MDILDTAITFLSAQSPYLLLSLVPIIPWYAQKRSERKARKQEDHEKKLLADFYGLVTSMGPKELQALLYIQGNFASAQWLRFDVPINAEMTLLLLRCGMLRSCHNGATGRVSYSLTDFGRRVLPETQIWVRKELELHGGGGGEDSVQESP